MKIDNLKINRSSFLSVEKDSAIIIDKMLGNERLKKLLFYNTKDALSKPNLTEEQSLGLLNTQIKTVPKLKVDPDVKSYIVITFTNFLMDATNPEFRDNEITFHVLCHFDQWQLEDFMLRPHRIVAEIDSMFNNQRLTGIGKLKFVASHQTVWNDEFGGIIITYEATHGEEDKATPLNEKQRELLFG